jgi:hypothetical protein
MSQFDLQAAIDAINAASQDWTDDADLLVAAKCRGLMRGYHERWKDCGYRVLETEEHIISDMYHLDTERSSEHWRVAGKVDAVVEIDGRSYLLDHKTTSADISDPNSPYWRQLAVEGQINHYMLMLWQLGRKVDGAVWDVIRKPSISPKKLPKAERAAIASLGTYCGQRVSDDAKAHVVAHESENHELYEIRLAHDCTKTRPEWYFQRRNVNRLDGEIAEYADELWEHGQDILMQQIKPKLPPRNSGACMLYGTPCKFLGICSGYDTPDSDKWARKEQVHVELDLDGDGRDVLTNSSIRCWQTCRRKYHYQYRMGLERADYRDSEALRTGTLFHIAMEAYFLSALERSAL